MKDNSIYVKVARLAIVEYLETNSVKDTVNLEVPIELRSIKPCFVTLKTIDGKLRGCIGTIKAKYKNLYTEIVQNAVSAAFRDHRFNPITAEEFTSIQISVEVLSDPEEIFDIQQLDPKVYGLIIQDELKFRGVLLPNIKGVDSIKKQIDIVKRKAGISKYKKTGLRYFRFRTEKFY